MCIEGEYDLLKKRELCKIQTPLHSVSHCLSRSNFKIMDGMGMGSSSDYEGGLGELGKR